MDDELQRRENCLYHCVMGELYSPGKQAYPCHHPHSLGMGYLEALFFTGPVEVETAGGLVGGLPQWCGIE